jgi:hypothetical protein
MVKTLTQAALRLEGGLELIDAPLRHKPKLRSAK